MVTKTKQIQTLLLGEVLCLSLSLPKSHLQFFVCGGLFSKRKREKRAVVNCNPRSPSPHSFSALKNKTSLTVVCHILFTYIRSK